MFSDIWIENAALYERVVEIHSNPPILYYGFKGNFDEIAGQLELGRCEHCGVVVHALDL